MRSTVANFQICRMGIMVRLAQPATIRVRTSSAKQACGASYVPASRDQTGLGYALNDHHLAERISCTAVDCIRSVARWLSPDAELRRRPARRRSSVGDQINESANVGEHWRSTAAQSWAAHTSGRVGDSRRRSGPSRTNAELRTQRTPLPDSLLGEEESRGVPAPAGRRRVGVAHRARSFRVPGSVRKVVGGAHPTDGADG